MLYISFVEIFYKAVGGFEEAQLERLAIVPVGATEHSDAQKEFAAKQATWRAYVTFLAGVVLMMVLDKAVERLAPDAHGCQHAVAEAERSGCEGRSEKGVLAGAAGGPATAAPREDEKAEAAPTSSQDVVFVNHPCVNAFTIAQTLAIVLSLLHPLREAYLDSIVFEAQFMVGQALVPMTLVVLGATLSGRRIFGSRDDQIPKKKKADHEPVPTSCRSGGGAQAQAEEEVAASSVPRDEFDLTVTGAFVIVLLRVLVANVCSVPLIYFLWKNEIRPFGEDSPRIVQSRNMALYFFILCASPPASNINLVCVTQDVMVRPMAKVFTLSQFTSIVTITLSVTVAVALLDDA
mmetsp:Transcript_13570/g.33354  ORF Transcript_13570/g.33354 Transcript_13570/m.33354 type:complete len:349 (-) Transcript_13570:468-1514(-)